MSFGRESNPRVLAAAGLRAISRFRCDVTEFKYSCVARLNSEGGLGDQSMTDPLLCVLGGVFRRRLFARLSLAVRGGRHADGGAGSFSSHSNMAGV
jgi:hypothetical protein